MYARPAVAEARDHYTDSRKEEAASKRVIIEEVGLAPRFRGPARIRAGHRVTAEGVLHACHNPHSHETLSTTVQLVQESSSMWVASYVGHHQRRVASDCSVI